MENIRENARKKALQKLDEMGIPYEIEEHPAVYTIEEMESFGIDARGDVVKNLFLCDEKKKRYFLVMILKDKRANLKSIRAQLGTSALSFASEDHLLRYMDLTKGAVSPLGILNDTEQVVEAVFDKDLKDRNRLGVHPNDNTATLWISFEKLKEVIERCGNAVHFIEVLKAE